MIKFNIHNVRDTETGKKTKIRYNLNFVLNGEKCVTLESKEFGYNLLEMFPESENPSDGMKDDFYKGKFRIPESHPLYQDALEGALKAKEYAFKKMQKHEGVTA